MMNEEQRQLITELVRNKVKECGILCERFDVMGTTKDHEFWMDQYLKYDGILAALTQPANPAFKLPPSIEPEDVPGLIDATANPDEYACCVGKDVWDACLREVAKLNAPHTAQIEPLCATGGAEWVKVPREPTRQMMSQGHFAMAGTDRGKFRRIYQAMIAAAPQTE